MHELYCNFFEINKKYFFQTFYSYQHKLLVLTLFNISVILFLINNGVYEDKSLYYNTLGNLVNLVTI